MANKFLYFQTLKDNYTKLRRYTYGHTDDIFEQTDIKHESS